MGERLRHVRQAVRWHGRSPLFAATAVLSLAVGIGANSAIFTAVLGCSGSVPRFSGPNRRT